MGKFRIPITVQPNSGRQEFTKTTEGEYKLFLKKSPEDRKANLELVKFFKKKLKWNVKIIRGFTSKRKLIEVN